MPPACCSYSPSNQTPSSCFGATCSDGLVARILRNAHHALQEQERSVPEHNVELLGHVSVALRMELNFEIYAPVFEIHPFFACYLTRCPRILRKVFHRAASHTPVSMGDVIFTEGEIPTQPRMFIVCSGSFHYTRENYQPDTVHEGQWISEGSLWTVWIHRGDLRAFHDSRLVVLDAMLFQEIVTYFDHKDFNPKTYVKLYIDYLNSAEVRKIQITDLPLGDDMEHRMVQRYFEGQRRSTLGLLTENKSRTSIANFGNWAKQTFLTKNATAASRSRFF